MIKDDAVHGNDGDIRGPAADVDDHVPRRLGNRQLGPDGGRHRLLDKEDLGRLGPHGHVLDRPALDLGDPGGNADHDARPEKESAVVGRFLDEEVQHLLGDLEVGDHPVSHRPDGQDVGRGFPEHLLGPLADGLDLAGLLVENDDGRFLDDDPLALHVDEGVGRSQVDG